MRTFTKKDNVVIAVVSIVIGIVGLSMYYWYFGATDREAQSTPRVAGYTTLPNHGKSVPTKSATTTALKTYINSDVGFSIKYPTDSLGLSIPAIFEKISVSATGLAYDGCSIQTINAHGLMFCPIRNVDHGVGMVSVDNEYITKSGNTYYSVKLSGDFKSPGTCAGIKNCIDYGMIQKMFEEQILPTFTLLK